MYFLRDNQLFYWDGGQLVGPTELDSLYDQELVATGAGRRRGLLQARPVYTIDSLDADSPTVYVGLRSG